MRWNYFHISAAVRLWCGLLCLHYAWGLTTLHQLSPSWPLNPIWTLGDVTVVHQGSCKMSSLTRKLPGWIPLTSALPTPPHTPTHPPTTNTPHPHLPLRLGYSQEVQRLGSCSDLVSGKPFFSPGTGCFQHEWMWVRSTPWVFNAPVHIMETVVWAFIFLFLLFSSPH